jgi:hypothetical protein
VQVDLTCNQIAPLDSISGLAFPRLRGTIFATI